MARRLPLVLLIAAFLVAPAAGDLGDKKAAVDQQIGDLQEKIDAARARESELSDQIDAVTSRIRSLEHEVGDVSAQVASLESDLALHQERLDKISELYDIQTRRLVYLRKQWEAATLRLNSRLVEIYKSNEPTELEVILSSSSFTEMLDQLDYVRAIGSQDRRIADEVGAAKLEIRRARAKTAKTKTTVAAATRVVQVRATQVRAVRDDLVTTQGQLEGSRSEQRETLEEVQHNKEEYLAEVAALAQVSAQLTAKIQAAQSRSTGAPPPSGGGGFQWPCAGGVTSPFGWRWGRMHEGIDLGCGYGAPIVAAASGTVIHAGWLGGYGNLVILDHGGGIATAYGHASSLAVSGGQVVTQGQTISYVGSTGHSTGPHLHFEVRVGGGPVDPLGYL